MKQHATNFLFRIGSVILVVYFLPMAGFVARIFKLRGTANAAVDASRDVYNGYKCNKNSVRLVTCPENKSLQMVLICREFFANGSGAASVVDDFYWDRTTCFKATSKAISSNQQSCCASGIPCTKDAEGNITKHTGTRYVGSSPCVPNADSIPNGYVTINGRLYKRVNIENGFAYEYFYTTS